MEDHEVFAGGEAPELESVLEARDSVAAEVARGLLESEGIPVMVQSFQVPWYDGIMTAGSGAWGRVLVPRHLAAGAREILSAYFDGSDVEGEESSPPEAHD